VARVPRLEVRVVVTNRGDEPAKPLDVVGELLGERREARVVQGVTPGGQAAVVLDFAAAEARPGLHALTLLLEHPVGGGVDAAGNPPVESQRAYLLLALGSNPGPAARIAVECPEGEGAAGCATSIGTRGEIRVRLESTDGEAHRMRVRALTARGLRTEGPPVTVTVPATGGATVEIPLSRSGAARGTRHGILVTAEEPDGPVARTAVATAQVDVAPVPALLPRLRGPLLVLGLALLAAAGAAEWRRHRPRG
jgi:hypothetical protein